MTHQVRRHGTCDLIRTTTHGKERRAKASLDRPVVPEITIPEQQNEPQHRDEQCEVNKLRPLNRKLPTLVGTEVGESKARSASSKSARAYTRAVVGAGEADNGEPESTLIRGHR